jgi:hypothetical protein
MVPEIVEVSRQIFLSSDRLPPPERREPMTIRRAAEIATEEYVVSAADVARALLELLRCDPDGTATVGWVAADTHTDYWEEAEDWTTLAQLLLASYVDTQLSRDVQLIEIEQHYYDAVSGSAPQ